MIGRRRGCNPKRSWFNRRAGCLWVGLTCLFAFSTPQAAELLAGERVTLTLPRPAAAHEAVWVEVRTGALPRGAEIEVRNRDGVLFGSVSPFGVRAGMGARYTIPLPRSAIVNNQVDLLLTVHGAGAAPRLPRLGEVEGVSLVYVPVDR